MTIKRSNPREVLNQAMDLLDTWGVESLVFRLDGGGDSGDVTVEACNFKETSDPSILEKRRPILEIGIEGVLRRVPWHIPDASERNPGLPQSEYASQSRWSLFTALENEIAEIPDFDWVNNEGGSGTITIYPASWDIAIDMSENVYEEEEDYDDYDDNENHEPA
jgi:hypothetical protein